MTNNIPNRRPHITIDLGMRISITVSFHPITGEVIDVFMPERGKASDDDLQNILYELGVTASKLIQKKDVA